MQHIETDFDDLSHAQQTALAALVEGKGVGETAERAGVSRITVYRWMKRPWFRDRLRDLREEMREVVASRLAGVMERAAEVVADAVDQGDAKMAFSLLKESGLLPGVLQPAPLADVDPHCEEDLLHALNRVIADLEEDAMDYAGNCVAGFGI